MLFCGLVHRLVNAIMKVVVPQKNVFDVTVIVSWINEDVESRCIYEASAVEVKISFGGGG